MAAKIRVTLIGLIGQIKISTELKALLGIALPHATKPIKKLIFRIKTGI